MATKPNAKIAVLYQNDDYGKDFLIGLNECSRARPRGMVVKEAPYEVSEPTVDSQMITLQGSGADVFLIAATPKAATQAIRKAYDIGWTPTRYLNLNAASIATVLKPAGLEKSKGVITAGPYIEVADPRWKDSPDIKEWQAFTSKYMSATEYATRRRLWFHRRRNDGAGAEAMRERSVAREHHAASGQP